MVARDATSGETSSVTVAAREPPSALPGAATSAASTMMPGSTIMPMPTPMPARMLWSMLRPAGPEDGGGRQHHERKEEREERSIAERAERQAHEDCHHRHREREGSQDAVDGGRNVGAQVVHNVEAQDGEVSSPASA